MGKGCINGKLDETKFSSPVPFIGLYIAAGSAVCMLFMLSDIISAFRHKKSRWIPCRLFSLNSLTLTLLAIFSKIPVDLTTPMPSVYDQLAKLTGTTLICVSMGFIYPSLAEQSDSEFLTNMISLVVFVVTVSVNICIQISTGVVYLFITEHIIIMVCMFILLFLLWNSTDETNRLSEILLDSNKDLMIKGEGSLLQRLKLCYLYGFNVNPQLRANREDRLQSLLIFCLISFGALVHASFRSILMTQLKTCPGISDYEWSMWVIISFQIITILVGFFAISFRCFNFFNGGDPSYVTKPYKEVHSIIRDNPILRSSNEWTGVLRLGFFVIFPIIFLAMWLIFFLIEGSNWFCCNCRYKRDEKYILTEYEDLVEGDEREMERWIVYKASSDMKRWMEVSRSEGVENLFELMSRTNPSPELCTRKTLNDLYPGDERGIEVSSLSMALLVKIASILLPQNLSNRLQHSFDEAYEIIDFVEINIKSTTYKEKTKAMLTKALLRGRSLGILLPKITEKPEYAADFKSQSPLDQARIILRELKSTLPPDLIAEEVGAITNVINSQGHQTVEDMYNYIEQMFVDMVYLFLVQFPNAIYKEVTDSSANEFEEKIARILKMLWKIESLEDQVTWLFPDVGGITSLITPRVPAILPNVSQGVGTNGSSPTEGVEHQACASVSDPPDDPLGVEKEAPSTIEDAVTPLSEIVVIPNA